MKKIVIGFMVLVICSTILMSTEENPFGSFMGMKWGMNAAEFAEKFEYDIKLYSGGFFLSNFTLGTLNIKRILFVFKNIGDEKDLKFKDKNFNQFIFSKAIMVTTPGQFENLLDIFTKKYGTPLKTKNSKLQNRMGAEFLQTIVFWENGDRMIALYRYGNKIDEGLVGFQSKSELNENKIKQENENKEAVDIL